MIDDEELIRGSLARFAERASTDRLAESGAELRRAAGRQGRQARPARLVLRRAVLAGLTVLLLAGLLTLGLVNGSSPPPFVPRTSSVLAPLADVAATPPGWSPVDFESVQISVPSGWLVEDPGYACGGSEGMVFISEAPHLPSGESSCVLTPDLVSLRPAGSSPVPGGHPGVVNGIRVERGQSRAGSTTTYLERGLGVDVAASGPLAQEVLGTLTHSPLSVVLGSVVSGTPSGWHNVAFGGLRFAVPDGWAVTRDSSWGGCPGGITPDVLRLSTAQTVSDPGCGAAPLPTAGGGAPVAGMVVGAGPQVSAGDVQSEQCVHRNGLRICIEPPPAVGDGQQPGRQLDLLTATVFLPGRSRPDQVEIGLVGSGLTPLRIFDSLEPVGGFATGVVTGRIDPCEGTGNRGGPSAAGTVTALSGTLSYQQTGPGTYRDVFPSAVAARETVGTGQAFRLVLPAGDYVLVATYSGGGNARSVLSVRVVAGAVLQHDMPNLCK